MTKETKRKKRESWPHWQTPEDKELLVLAKTLLPHIKILDPEIVRLVAKENNKYLDRWTEALNQLGIKADIYLWRNSPVTFPGIRRHSGTKEVSDFGKNPKTAKGDNALAIDDNSFPKELWSFALRNCKYDKTNPPNFSLAHILDHKDYKSRNGEELIGFQKTDDKHLFAGLFTSRANTIWVPNNLLKPTDHKGNLRLLLIQIINKYYSSVCNVLPHNLSFNLTNIHNDWELENFTEPTIVGNIEFAKNFLSYRNNIICERLRINESAKFNFCSSYQR